MNGTRGFGMGGVAVSTPFRRLLMDSHPGLGCIFLLILLSGCGSTPYVAARHMSDPSIDNDGYDLACGGLKTRGRLSIKGGWCANLRGGDMVELDIEYELFRRDK